MLVAVYGPKMNARSQGKSAISARSTIVESPPLTTWAIFSAIASSWRKSGPHAAPRKGITATIQLGRKNLIRCCLTNPVSVAGHLSPPAHKSTTSFKPARPAHCTRRLEAAPECRRKGRVQVSLRDIPRDTEVLRPTTPERNHHRHGIVFPLRDWLATEAALKPCYHVHFSILVADLVSLTAVRLTRYGLHKNATSRQVPPQSLAHLTWSTASAHSQPHPTRGNPRGWTVARWTAETAT